MNAEKSAYVSAYSYCLGGAETGITTVIICNMFFIIECSFFDTLLKTDLAFFKC